MRSLPTLIVVLWLALVSGLVWEKAQRSEQPPVYDTLTYFQKAKNLWANFHSSKPVNPLNLEPTFRPPGTVLMSYPLGFVKDFHGFYFRSVVMPVMILVLAVYVIGFDRSISQRQHWNLAALALLFASAPMFFHFERSESAVSPLIWGMVDNFMAAVAALAVAASVRSIQYASLAWCSTAALLAALCLLIKPSGLFVMAMMSIVWALGVVVRAACEAAERQKLLKLLWQGAACMALLYVVVVAICARSQYFSAANVTFGTAAIEVMRSELALPLPILLRLLRACFGCVLPVALVSVWLAWLISRWRPSEGRIRVAGTMAFCAIAALLFGLWFWVWGTAGATQIRYFFPFATISLTLTVPAGLILLERAPRVAAHARAVMLAPAANILLLLMMPASSAWQAWSGVNLTSGTFKAETQRARDLVSLLRSEGKGARMYSFYSDAATAAFESVGAYERVLNPELPNFQVFLPVDWRRPSVFRVNDIVTSDYILFALPRDQASVEKSLQQTRVRDFWEENALFHAWFSRLTERDGVAIVAETPLLRLLRIKDVRRLESRIAEFTGAHVWPASFVEANPPRWWTPQQLEAEQHRELPALSGVKFGGMFHLRSLTLKRQGNQITARVWWQRLQNATDVQWYFFFHLLDNKKGVIVAEHLRLAPNLLPARETDIVLDIITFPVPPGREVSAIGVGITDAKGTVLTADSGNRDWNNRRVLLPMP